MMENEQDKNDSALIYDVTHDVTHDVTPDLKWLFLDLDSYFASVEQQDRPWLRGKPVVVVPVLTDSTCAIAASLEAKHYGIKTGTPIWEAKKRCPGLHIVLARHEIYTRYHHAILAAVETVLPVHKVWSIDEVACLLLGAERQRANAQSLALQIKQAIADKVGTHLRCSIGLAPTRLLAKIASDMGKPNGLLSLTHADLPGPLLGLALRDLPGIGSAMEKRLFRAGITTMAGLWALNARQMRAIWGSIEGERFYYMLHGTDIPETQTTRRSIGHSHVMAPELRSPEQARLVARRLALKAASRMRRLDLQAGALVLSVRIEGGQPGVSRWAGEVKLDSTADSFAILARLDTLWRAMIAAHPGQRIQKAGVLLHRLQTRENVTPDLFAPVVANHARQAAKPVLNRMIDRLNSRYGRDCLMFGLLPAARRGDTGSKIAFTRIPDLAEFHE